MGVDCLWGGSRCSRIPLPRPSSPSARTPSRRIAVLQLWPPPWELHRRQSTSAARAGANLLRHLSGRRTASRSGCSRRLLSGRCRRGLLQQRLLGLLQHVPQDDLLMRVVGLRAGRQRRRTRDRPTRIDLFGVVRGGQEHAASRPPSTRPSPNANAARGPLRRSCEWES